MGNLNTLRLHQPAGAAAEPATVRDLLALQDNVRSVVDPLVKVLQAAGVDLAAVQAGAVTAADLTAALAAYLALAGGTMAGDIAMGSNQVTGMAAGGASGDGVEYDQWQAALGGGSLIHISTQTIGTQASVEVEAGIDSTYKSYLWHLLDLTVGTDDRGLRLTVGDSGGYKSTVYKWAFHHIHSNGSSIQVSSNSDAHIELAYESAAGAGVGSAAGEVAEYWIEIMNPAGTANYKLVKFRGVYVNSAGYQAEIDGGGHWSGDVTALTKLKITPETGNLTGGIATLYGIANS